MRVRGPLTLRHFATPPCSSNFSPLLSSTLLSSPRQSDSEALITTPVLLLFLCRSDRFCGTMMAKAVRAWVRSKRYAVRCARAQGDSACREMHIGLPQACEGRRTAKNMWTYEIYTRRWCAPHCCADGAPRVRMKRWMNRSRQGRQFDLRCSARRAREP